MWDEIFILEFLVEIGWMGVFVLSGFLGNTLGIDLFVKFRFVGEGFWD